MPSPLQLLHPGLLFTASIGWVLALFGWFISFVVWREAQPRQPGGRRDRANLSFALFWFLFSFVWLFLGIRLLFAALGLEQLDHLFFYVAQVFIFLHMVPAGFYIYLKVFKKEGLALGMSGLLFLLALLAIFLLFRYGMITGPVSEFTTEYGPNPLALNIFRLMLILGLPLYYYQCLRIIFLWLKRRGLLELPSFLASFAIVLYASLGYFDEKGYMADWPLVFFRLSYLFAIFLVYLSLALKEPSPRVEGQGE